MGLFDFIFGSDTNTDPKSTKVSEKDDVVTVRNSSVIYDSSSDKGKHETIWSKTEVDVNTGASKTSEGGHGSNFNK